MGDADRMVANLLHNIPSLFSNIFSSIYTGHERFSHERLRRPTFSHALYISHPSSESEPQFELLPKGFDVFPAENKQWRIQEGADASPSLSHSHNDWSLAVDSRDANCDALN
jgi:hypothetical protein